MKRPEVIVSAFLVIENTLDWNEDYDRFINRLSANITK